MKKEELLALAEKYQAKAYRAYAAYQETGLARYDRERCNNEDVAEAIRMAASAADDHAALVSMRGTVCDWAVRVQELKYKPDDLQEQATKALLSDIAAMGRIWGMIREEKQND